MAKTAKVAGMLPVSTRTSARSLRDAPRASAMRSLAAKALRPPISTRPAPFSSRSHYLRR